MFALWHHTHTHTSTSHAWRGCCEHHRRWVRHSDKHLHFHNLHLSPVHKHNKHGTKLQRATGFNCYGHKSSVSVYPAFYSEVCPSSAKFPKGFFWLTAACFYRLDATQPTMARTEGISNHWIQPRKTNHRDLRTDVRGISWHISCQHTITSIRDSLLALHSIYVPLSHRFWDIARYWSKTAVLTYPTSI